MKYIVKTTYTATADHPYEKEGTTKVWYHGKGNRSTKDFEDFIHGYFGLYEGWSRKHFADRDIAHWNEWYNGQGKTDAWDVKMEVVSY